MFYHANIIEKRFPLLGFLCHLLCVWVGGAKQAVCHDSVLSCAEDTTSEEPELSMPYHAKHTWSHLKTKKKTKQNHRLFSINDILYVLSSTNCQVNKIKNLHRISKVKILNIYNFDKDEKTSVLWVLLAFTYISIIALLLVEM